jgi:hypothetical protein|tara:strand:+ start:195 stop:407 length:213 start_codon:yes stop_codon:yes gene_type:complete
MSLQGQGLTAYKEYMNRAMKKPTKVESIESGGLMNRNKPIAEKDKNADPSDYLLEQFMQIQKLRMGLKNG